MAFNWGNYPAVTQQAMKSMHWRDENPFLGVINQPVLPYGNGRSYGDSCLNQSGVLINTLNLNHLIAFDNVSGLLRCESGVLLADILSVVVPQGWILAVMPGTKFVSIGGAIANDVHGKNHHQAGTFGCHVIGFELMRSNGERINCSRESQPDLFSATIGGLGLTGLILWADIQLQPLVSTSLDIQTIAFKGLKECVELSKQFQSSAYTVSWLDCQTDFARGLFIAANPVESNQTLVVKKTIKVPCYLPSIIMNGLSSSLFNSLYYHTRARKKKYIDDYNSYLFPLDAIIDWNKLYGRRGFLQYQLVIPLFAEEAFYAILKKIADSRLGSFLSVLKLFGEVVSPGMLSFPMPGISLALDFPNKKPVFALLDKLDDIVRCVGGRVYIAKDARMSAAAFRAYYPGFTRFKDYIDPNISSDFLRRILE